MMAGARQRPRSARKVVAVGVGAAVVVGGGGAALALTGSSGPDYRLATVMRGTIAQTVSTTGTIASVNSATLQFPVSGTIADVAVQVGDSVRAGETVATLNTTQLEQQLQQAQVAAAAARKTLADDLAQQSSGSDDGSGSDTGDTSTPTPTSTPSSAPRKPSGPSTAQLVAAVKRAQQKLLADQHAADVDADLVASTKAIVAANEACAALLADTPTPTASPSASPSNSSSSSATDDLQACQQAIADVQAAQQKVQHDLELLTADEKALDAAVAALIAALERSSESGGSRTQSAGPSAAHPSTSSSATGTDATNGTGKSPTGSNGGNGSSGTVVTAAQLAADQKRIDAADAQVTVAQQTLQQATLTSPIAGTVGAVSMAAGDSVSAGSTTATVTVLGPGQSSVQVLVGIRDIDLVKKGQTATVNVDGVSKPLTGHVTVIGVLNSSGTSGDTTTYPVTIVLDGSPRLYDGAGASVSIAVGAASNVLTVPLSALHGSGTSTTVTLYDNGTTESRRVTVGARGTDRVEIKSGLSAGDQVVLARVDAAVPTSSNNQGRFGRNGGFGGAGGGGPVVMQGPKGASGK
ncbi:MAG TPA: efflux RND transporter periplasmic adaptor subunit [Jatrophihabitantaceae bacterium]|nr:efflux RND transporter periplasmic adaptor subunit [Jatrophihabitantaceae bacterium]